MHEAFEIFSAAFEAAQDDAARVEVAVRFFKRLGAADAYESAMDHVASALAINHNPAGTIIQSAIESYDEEAIRDAVIYATR